MKCKAFKTGRIANLEDALNGWFDPNPNVKVFQIMNFLSPGVKDYITIVFYEEG